MLSKATIPAKYRWAIWLIMIAACATAVISGAQRNMGQVVLIISLLMLGLTWAILSMRVIIETDGQTLVLHCKPFFKTRLPLTEVLTVDTAAGTTLAVGFGYRILGAKTRGIIVGGPAVTIRTERRTWVVSAKDPQEVAATIRRLALQK